MKTIGMMMGRTNCLLTKEAVIAARLFKQNPNRWHLDPVYYGLLMDVIIHEKGVAEIESERNWPARSAKVVIAVALQALADRNKAPETKADADPSDVDATEPDVDDAQAMLEYVTADFGDEEVINYKVNLGLTVKEARLLVYLIRAPGNRGTKESILSGLYYDRPHDMPEIKIVDVFICKLRKKLQGTKFTISTIWGVGYQLTITEQLTHDPSLDVE